MKERTPQNGGIIYPNKFEDFSKVKFSQYPFHYPSGDKIDDLIAVTYNATARRDTFLETLKEDFDQQPIGNKGRIRHQIYILVLADELEFAGFRYEPKRE